MFLALCAECSVFASVLVCTPNNDDRLASRPRNFTWCSSSNSRFARHDDHRTSMMCTGRRRWRWTTPGPGCSTSTKNTPLTHTHLKNHIFVYNTYNIFLQVHKQTRSVLCLYRSFFKMNKMDLRLVKMNKKHWGKITCCIVQSSVNVCNII